MNKKKNSMSATIADTATLVSGMAGTRGTPAYMSPQQKMGGKSQPTDDIYSLGATLFFFQAEDGIRHYKVTGVQTCALPISECRREHTNPRRSSAWPSSKT